MMSENSELTQEQKENMTKIVCPDCGFELYLEQGFIEGRCSCDRTFKLNIEIKEMEKQKENDEIVRDPEWAAQQWSEAWEEFWNAIHEIITPIVDKLAEILDSWRKEEP